MANDVVLSAALRSNLLSLQSTQKGIDSAQFKLSTGKKVNSALDNPQSFFASQALTNRAADLTKLLDGIGQSIQVIKAADNGVTALTSLVNSAQAIATSAQDAVTNGSGAKIVGTTALGSAALAGFTNNDTFDITAIDANGNKNRQTITLNTGETGNSLVAKINAAFSASSGQITASLDSSGFLNISAASGSSFRIDNFKAAAGTMTAQATASTFVGNLGLANYFRSSGEENAGAATQFQGATILAGSTITSGVLTSGGIATGATKISALNGFNITAATNTFSIAFDNAAPTTGIDLFTGNMTIQGLVDKINTTAAYTGKLTASFDSTTGKLSLNITDATIKSVSIGQGNTTIGAQAWGFGTGRADGSTADNVTETFAVPSTAAVTNATLSSLQTQYNNIRTQIDQLVTNGDTSYRGTNLLNGNSLVTNFNELRTSKLTTSGVTFNASGLGLAAANFSTATSISANLTQITGALTSLRNFGSALAGDLSTIQTRQDFTSSVINTLTTGSDLLVNADQNEEGAKLLALQTRQSLGVTALSLASQSQQSILRLFG
ncbi:MAG: flaA [Micavibrio sp.]|nr:flaA [Micavibrio sp.]